MSNFWKDLKKPFLVLAPMEGVTDVVFRQVVAKAGAPDVFYTEFTNVSSYASEKGRHNALERLEIAKNEGLSRNGTPIVAQIWGKNPEHFAETAAVLEDLGFDGLDINMGCPDKHVNKAGGGAAMIKTPELAVECIKKAKEATNLPVSVKTRLGFTYVDEYKEWIKLLLEQDLAALTVHLRTRKEMSKVDAHFELIPEIVKMRDEIAPETVLMINGDIRDMAHAKELSELNPGVDGFMIGRGVFANPFCFTEKEPTPSELKELFLYHLDLFDAHRKKLEENGSYYSFEPLKHFYKVYFHNQPNSAELRAKLMDCKTTDELRACLTEFEKS